MRVKCLYIIGNGFDRFHSLKTDFEDFYHYLQKNNIELLNQLENYFEFQDSNSWKDFENTLATFNSELYFEEYNNISVSDENFKMSCIYSLEDEFKQLIDSLAVDISESFENWILEINEYKINQKIVFKENSVFLSFNYTDVLESIYKIPKNKVLHIHGRADGYNNLIFGHGSEIEKIPEIGEDGEILRTPFTETMNVINGTLSLLKKPVEDLIKQHLLFWDQLTTVSEIYILGHSLNEVDIPYFKMIYNITKGVHWNINYHSESSIAVLENNLIRIGLSNEDYTITKILK